MKRPLLYPFALLYRGITSLRNFAFDQGWIAQNRVNACVISVGNLRVGGTGKTPHTAFILSTLSEVSKAVLSRGYGRRTSGFLEVSIDSTPQEVGDEPKELKLSYPTVPIAVCEDRTTGARRLIEEHKPQVILLDDAFQHRHIARDLNVLITEYDRPFWDDEVLPAGDLREPSRGALRADVIIISKCPENLTLKEAERIESDLCLHKHQNIFYTRLNMGNPERKMGSHPGAERPFLLVTGIDNPSPIAKRFSPADTIRFKDHHNYQRQDIERILERAQKKGLDILTTQKDYVKLSAFEDLFENCGLFTIPLEVEFLFEGRSSFVQILNKAIVQFESR